MLKRYVSLLVVLAAGNVTASASAAAQQSTVMGCFSQQRSDLDDGISPANVIAKAIVHACRDVVLEAVKRRHPSQTAMGQKIMAFDAERGLEADAVELVLKARAKDNKPIVPTYKLGDVFPVETTRFKVGKCSWECEYRGVTGDREETIGVAPSKQNRIISTLVVTHPSNEPSCRKAVDNYLRLHESFDVRQVSQAEVDNDPLLRELQVIRYYRGKKGDTSFQAGCFVLGGKFEVQLSEMDDRTHQELIGNRLQGGMSVDGRR